MSFVANRLVILFLFLQVLFMSACNTAPSSRDALEEKVEAAFSERRYDDAYKLLVPLAERGDPDSEFALGLLILGGQVSAFRGMNADAIEAHAVGWIHKAAIHGNAEAMLFMSDCYKYGRHGLAVDLKLAEKWMKLAAAKTSK